MKKLITNKYNLFFAFALAFGLVLGANTVAAATYSYVDTTGRILTVEASSATAAQAMAVGIAPRSGVVEGRIGTTVVVATTPMMNQGNSMNPSTETKAADLRVTLNSLLKEHVNLGMIALYNVIDNHESTEASVEALDENTVELAQVIGSVYGGDAEASFRQLWRDHIGFFANYATGLRTNDEDLREEAEEDLRGYQQDIADFFNSALPNIDKSTVIAGAGEHKDLLLEAMDEYHAEDFDAAYSAQREGDKQISGIANLLAKEIVKQNPSKF